MKKILTTISILLISTAIYAQTYRPERADECPGEYIQFTDAEKRVINGADERIEQHRKGTATLKFEYPDRTRVQDADVKIEQISHEFLFGANHGIKLWKEIADKKLGVPNENAELSEEQLNDYLEKHNNFSNYNLIPASWGLYEPQNNEYNDELYDKAYHWIKAQGESKIRTSPNIWASYTPAWVSDDCSELSIELEERMRHFLSSQKGKYDYLHIINELANPYRLNFLEDKMTPCIKNTGQLEWGKKWLSVAREEDPNAKLEINEVSIGPEKGFPELLDGLKDNNGNRLYDTIGIQSHMHQKLQPLDIIWEILEGYASFGVPLQFTEVTILSGTPITGNAYRGEITYGKTTTPEGECKQADYVVGFYTVLFSHPAVEAVNWWNLADYKSWFDAPAGLLRRDMSPKPSYHALMDLIYNKWWTTVQTSTTVSGDVEFRGFYGDYKITVTTKSGESETFNIKLSKDKDTDFILTTKVTARSFAVF